ncbi:hypothetical protein ACFL2E_13485, partial [Thermodesulfobacteriota bacterium]
PFGFRRAYFFARKEGGIMTEEEKGKYLDSEVLRKELTKLRGMKFRLDCGHHVTLNHNFGNNLVIYNGKKLELVCTFCAY